MVTNVTSFGRSGLSDWLVQRVTAVILAAYTIFIVAYLLFSPELTYQQWAGLHQNILMKVFSLAAILSVAAHAWIGLWSVLTDYITVRVLGPKATPLRIVLQLGMIIVTLAYVVWAIDILWGI
ncbi:MAG: succinate dehydrogenase, hydrophobic membrane anchor protein [Porticoccaceae bacterium]|jgi:succinate dehydrogenase / fumarate reductase membrane anchor subunit